MNKTKFYKLSSIALLLLNIILVSAFFITKPKGRDRDRINPKEYFKMDEVQHDLFFDNLEAHHEEIRSIRDKQVEILEPYLYSVGDSQDSTEHAMVMHMMKELEGKKLTSLYKHLQDLKGMLNDDQLPLFDSFLKERCRNMTAGDKKRPPSKRK